MLKRIEYRISRSSRETMSKESLLGILDLVLLALDDKRYEDLSRAEAILINQPEIEICESPSGAIKER